MEQRRCWAGLIRVTTVTLMTDFQMGTAGTGGWDPGIAWPQCVHGTARACASAVWLRLQQWFKTKLGAGGWVSSRWHVSSLHGVPGCA